jgi:lysozyme
MARKINAAGRELVKSFEGLRLDAYRCPAGILTVGFGSTGPHVKEGMTISLDEAETLLSADLARFERGVEAMTETVPTSDDQFAALVSLAFNIGLGAFAGSTVLKRHKLGNRIGAANAFLMWNRAKGQVLKGLTRRREAERRLYLGETQ